MWPGSGQELEWREKCHARRAGTGPCGRPALRASHTNNTHCSNGSSQQNPWHGNWSADTKNPASVPRQAGCAAKVERPVDGCLSRPVPKMLTVRLDHCATWHLPHRRCWLRELTLAFTQRAVTCTPSDWRCYRRAAGIC